MHGTEYTPLYTLDLCFVLRLKRILGPGRSQFSLGNLKQLHRTHPGSSAYMSM